MGQWWGSLSVSDHVKRRALVAQVLLFDRLLVPVPPDDDVEEGRRWADNNWMPKRQRRFLDILGTGPREDDLAVPVPWTKAKRDRFHELTRRGADSLSVRREQADLVSGLQFDATQLRPDAFMETRRFLTREYDSREDDYVKALPRVWVEKVMPAYASYQSADTMLGFRSGADPGRAAVEVLGWELFVPERSDWSDDRTLEAAAKLARSDDYRLERESFRDYWRGEIAKGVPPAVAAAELARRADRINKIVRAKARRTRVLRGFAAAGAVTSIAGAWFPPVAVAGGFIALVGIGADWVLKDDAMPTSLAPATMFADARRHLGWRG